MPRRTPNRRPQIPQIPQIPSELMHRVLNGDESAINIFLGSSHFQQIAQKSFCQAGLHSRHWEDAMQELRLKCFRKITTLNPSENIEGWLYTVARNIAIDFRRNQRRWTSIIMEEAPKLENVSESRTNRHPEQILIQQELIVLALAEVHENWKEALLLSVAGSSGKEIADKLQLNPVNVRTRIHRGRERFKEAYQALLSAA